MSPQCPDSIWHRPLFVLQAIGYAVLQTVPTGRILDRTRKAARNGLLCWTLRAYRRPAKVEYTAHSTGTVEP